MAKISFFISPFDSNKLREFEVPEISVKNVLADLEIEDRSMCLTLNGTTPDNFDLDYVLKDEDHLEIRFLLEGGDADVKSSLATVIQIAALIAISAVDFGATATTLILAGASVASGVLNKWAMDLRGAGGIDDKQELDTSTNSYSLTTASNEARPLAPMPIPMGSHRFAPDIHCEAFVSYFGTEYNFGEVQPDTSGHFLPGQSIGNGATAVNNNWVTIPQNYWVIGPDAFPTYEIKVEPSQFNLPPGPVSPANQAAVLAEIYQRYFAPLVSWQATLQFRPGADQYMPLVMYHSTPTDPFAGRYGLFHFLAVQWFYRYPVADATNYANDLTALYNGTTSSPVTNYWLSNSIVTVNRNAAIVTTIGGTQYFYPSTLTSADSISTVMTKLSTFLQNINMGSYVGPKPLSYPVQKIVRRYGLVGFNKEGILYSTQAFSYGIGDMTITERKVGSTDVESGDMTLAVYSPVNKGTVIGQPQWRIPPLNGALFNPVVQVFAEFYNEVYALPGKRLSNPNQTEEIVTTNSPFQYNFTYLEGQDFQNMISFSLVGQLYSTGGGGIGSNTTTIQVQWKMSDNDVWTDYLGGLYSVIILNNDNTKRLTLPYIIVADFPPGGYPSGVHMQVRIRKATLDANDNEGGKVCNISIDHIRFCEHNGHAVTRDGYKLNAPIQRDGLFTTAMIADSAQTNKFSAMVETKCWVYDFDTETWSWTFNRNPAFWFLYFAYGGFLNENAVGAFTYPYSPTRGWVNYPGHPDSTERIFGAGYSNEQIDLDKILSWALFCEENELNLDMVFKDDVSVSEALDKIANVGRGSTTYYHGLLSVVYENQDDTPVAMFGMANIVAGSFSVDYAVADPVRKVIGKYTNRDTWETAEVESIVPFSDPLNIRFVEVVLDGITDSDVAQRTVNLLAARQFYQRRTYSWSTDAEGYLADRGDLVYLSHDSTQYGFSGRIMQFIMTGGLITGIKTTAILDSSTEYVSIRHPDGVIYTYECTVDGSNIMFSESYPIERASFFIDNETDNADTDYQNSIPEDFIFIAGAKETPGKIVRIAEVRPNEDGTFTYVAVDEDAAMWAYEYDTDNDPTSFEDAEVVLSIANAKVQALGEGLVKVYWESVNGDYVQILNDATGLPIESSGSYSFTGGEVTLELIPGQNYTLVIRPLAIGTPFKSVSQKVSVWVR